MSPTPAPLPSERGDVRPETPRPVGVADGAGIADRCADGPGFELQLFDQSPAVQLLIEPGSGLVVDANPAACAFYGVARNEIAGRKITEIDGFSPSRFAEVMASGERRSHLAFSQRHASGELRDVEVLSGPLEIGGRRLILSTVLDVTDKRRAEEALQRFGEKYRTILEGIEEGYYEVDLEGRFTLCNDALCRTLGVSREELLRSVATAGLPDPASRLFSYLSAIYGSGRAAAAADGEIALPDGKKRYVAASVTLVRDGLGRPNGFRGVVRDVTERKRAEQLQSALYRIGETAGAVREMDAFYAAIHAIVGELMDARNFYIALRDEASRTIGFPYFVDEADPVPPRVKSGKSLTEYVIRTGQPLLAAPAVFEDLRARGEIELLGAPSLDWLGVPLKRGEAAFGVLAVQSYSEQVRFTEGDRDILTFVAQHVASALERKRAVDALRESEIRFRTLAETAPCAIFIYQDSEIRYVNAVAAETSGYAPEELLRMSFWDLVHPEFHEPLRERGFARQRGDAVPLRSEFKILTKGREERWLDFSTGLIEFAGETAVLGTAFDVTERRRADEQIKALAYHDPLTGLPNRLLFADRLSLAVAQAHRLKHKLAVLFLDLDGFKVINDSLGHSFGDRLLAAVAERLHACLREGDTVARQGGDEFTLLLPGIPGSEEAARVAEKIQDALRLPQTVDGRELFVTASLGISLYPEDGEDAETLVKNADVAMYRAKEQGRNRYELFTPGLNARALERLATENELRRALAHGEFVVHYQPLVDLETGRIPGVEALLRWQHPVRGLVGAGEFVALAELTGILVPIGPWILRTACAQAREWQARGHPGLRVSVNLSARQLQQSDLVRQVRTTLDETGLDAGFLELEIAETIAMQGAEAAKVTLSRLKALGVRISIDDFGIGHASLTALRSLPIDALKIDRSFVRNVTSDPAVAVIAESVIDLAHALGLQVVAEGVETEEQRVFLAAHRCDRMQGHLFSQPVPADVCSALLERSRAR
jgi:diguanylate cyclase (GGDEF)-like protein/PAS domain S-box-containing protein